MGEVIVLAVPRHGQDLGSVYDDGLEVLGLGPGLTLLMGLPPVLSENSSYIHAA